ncbi:CSEP0104 putative effector protein [Blumeria hordei DH14]|uniref:CSEP0104 putative effector protein n=1 Tax=Blumeria graminis f. sp. hordei (strain DH14) TaxID=546991 RepID=N1J8E6_BLUG1|nr:CSEP0104 putative effector protein [Blumeria hordei DH14]
MFKMRSAHIASLSFIFGFLILESVAEYKCPSQVRIPDSDVETRANEIYSRGVYLDSNRTPGENQIEEIEFYGDSGSGDLAFTGDFSPPFSTSNTYKITVEYSPKKIILTEKNTFVGGNIEAVCKKY